LFKKLDENFGSTVPTVPSLVSNEFSPQQTSTTSNSSGGPPLPTGGPPLPIMGGPPPLPIMGGPPPSHRNLTSQETYNTDSTTTSETQVKVGFGSFITVDQLGKTGLRNMEERKKEDIGRHEQKIIGWVNNHLAHLNIKVNNLQKDLQDGVVYFKLLEILTGKKI
jgi:hypothetical protein